MASSTATAASASPTTAPLVVASEHTGASALVFLPASHLDAATEAQIKRMVDHPAVQRARVMPDCHKGTGCCVGFTCALGACVSPAIIGGDIGCGISALPLPATARCLSGGKALEKLLATVHAVVPMGNGAKGDHGADGAAGEVFVDQVLAHADAQLGEFVAAFDAKQKAASADGDAWSATRPTLDRAWLDQRLRTWELPMMQLCRQAGTLGGGNHFFEVGALDDDGAHAATSADLPPGLLIVHSGSRCVGQAVYRYWMRVALRNARQHDGDGDAEEANEQLRRPAANDDDEIDASSAYSAAVALTDADARGYCADMVFAQSFAVFNRARMLTAVARAANFPLPQLPAADETAEADAADDEEVPEDDDPLAAFLRAGGNQGIVGDDDEADNAEDDADDDDAAAVVDPSLLVDSTHNYIDFHDWTVRKGAIRAHRGERCLIAQNMRDGVWLCEGRGAAEWNMSAPHGTGRVKGRTAAAARDKKQAEALLKQFRQEMAGVLTRSVSVDTLDERPSVYRDSGVVAAAMGDAVTILGHYRPLANAK